MEFFSSNKKIGGASPCRPPGQTVLNVVICSFLKRGQVWPKMGTKWLNFRTL
jgi:hypothetical protein